jgi:sporulation protein YabP
LNETISVNEHSLTYSNNTITITSVIDAKSFEESSITLILSSGMLFIKGIKLSVMELNLKSGIIRLSGELTSLDYKERHIKSNFFKRLLK